MENCLLASRVYAQKYPDRDHPRKCTFEILLGRFRETGSVAYGKINKNKPITGDNDNELNVILSVTEDPTTSARRISNEIGLSRTSVSRILKKNKYHAYHIQMHQHLSERDFGIRTDFSLWILDKVGEDPNFLKYVLFTDESTFHNNGLVNRHNFHYYDTENRHTFRTIDRQQRWSVNVWGGIIGDFVIGPHFFEGILNGRTFFNFLEQEFSVLLDDVPIDIRRKMMVQMDGAPAHFSFEVRNFLNTHFSNRWIGRGSGNNWPPRSPDLTPVDFFLWGYIKNIVYFTPPTSPEDMKMRITNAFASITSNTLKNVRESFEDRIAHCIEQDGKQIEHLL